MAQRPPQVEKPRPRKPNAQFSMRARPRQVWKVWKGEVACGPAERNRQPPGVALFRMTLQKRTCGQCPARYHSPGGRRQTRSWALDTSLVRAFLVNSNAGSKVL